MTRLWPAGQPIVVETRNDSGSEQVPSQFTWQGRSHLVTEITKIWRVDMDWWRVRIWRAYFKISTDTGLLVVVYRDLMSEEWFLQRLYD